MAFGLLHTEKTELANRENTRRRHKFQTNTKKWKFEAFGVKMLLKKF